MIRRFALGLALASLAAPALAQAPSWSRDQMGVWAVVAQSWADEVARNGKWPAAYVHDQVVGWDASWPMPRYKASMEKWSRFSDQQQRTLEYEVSPAAIAMSGNTAVVHYTGVLVTQRGQDKPEREMIAAVETLVRDGGNWKFLSISGFDLKKEGD